MKKNTWIELPSHPELLLGQYIVPNFVSNSIAIKVNEKEYVLVSPGAQMLKDWPEALKADDVKISIIMPNGFHYMGVSAWQAVFPNAKLYANAEAIPRLLEQGVKENTKGESDSIGIRPLQDEQPNLPAGYDVLMVPGHREGETWVRKQDSKNGSTWITCDSFLNYDRMSNQPIARFLQKVLGAAPGLKMSQVVKWVIIKDRKSFKGWALKQLELDQPTTLIPSHGEVSQDANLAKDLEALLLARL